MNSRMSPCMTCTRVADPRACENKNCQMWQRWFIARWEAMRRNVRIQMELAPREPVGVVISGRHYAAPHQVRTYLQTDPCHGCVCQKDLCYAPCPSRRSWELARQDVLS